MGIILGIFSLSGKTPVFKDVLKTWVGGLIIGVIICLTIFIIIKAKIKLVVQNE